MEEESFGGDQTDEALSGDRCLSSESNQETLNEDRPYKCNQCDKSYRHAGSLVNHKKTHQIGLYTCLICQKEYSNPMGLKSHLRTHSEEKRFRCEQCGEAFRMSQQLYNHRKSSHAFYSGAATDKPARSHKANTQPPSLMESSNLMSNLENYIAESMVPVDFSQLVTKYYQEEMSQAKEPAKEDGGTGRVTTESFRGEQTLNDSNPEEYRYKCNQCDKAYKHAGSLANHKQTHVVGVYQCAICFKEFSNLLAMKNHCRLHSDSKPRQRCKSPRNSRVGGLPLPSTDTLQNDHLHSTDFTESYEAVPGVSQVPGNQNCYEGNTDLTLPSDCHQDDPQTNSAVALQSSSQNSTVQVEVHSVAPNSALPDLESASDEYTKEQECNEDSNMADLEDRPFKCLECGKSYRHAGSLINHKKTHQTGVYSCSLCSKQMFNMAALKNHFRAHFKSRPGRKMDDTYFHSASFSDFFQNPGDPFQCAICGDFFTNESDFLQHQELHTEEAVQKTCNDTRMSEKTSELGKFCPENTQEPQIHSTSFYTGAPSVSNVKTEVENPADQHMLCPSRPEDPLVSPSKINPIGDSQDPPRDFDQLALEQTLKEEESSRLDEEGDTSAIDRPYKCEACGRTYRHKSSLINHKLTHKTGIYQCSLCPKQYSNLMALKNHLRFHSRSYTGRRGIFSRRTYPFFRGRARFLQNKTSAVSAKLRDWSPEANTQTTSVGTLTPDSCSCGELFNCKEDFDSHRQICNNSSRVSISELSVDFNQNKSSMRNLHDVSKTPEKKEKTGPHEKVLENSEHGRKVYECDLCDKAYRHSGSLINHKRTHQIGDYTCPYCSRHVHNMAALKNHIRIHHKFEKGKPGDERNCNLFYTDLYFPHADNSNVFDCPRCEETFNSEEDLVAHQMVHIALGGDSWEQKAQHSHAPGKDLSMETEGCEGEHSSNSDLHGTNNLEKGDIKLSEDDGNCVDYTCVECGEVYNSIGDLNTHKLTHQIGIYQCSFCPKEYPSLLALKSHFQSHTKPQVLRKYRKHITNRAERMGLENQPTLDGSYDCGHCGLAFSNEVDFHQHQVSHEKQVAGDSFHCHQTEGKEPDATFCMDSSEQELLRSIKSELEEPEPSANDVASQLSHICGFCGKTYDDLESLQAHSLTHSAEETPPPANKANSGTENAQTLNEEENIDTARNEDSSERRPYACKQCGKSYRHGGSLVNHRKTHLVGNFQCLACFRLYPNMAAYQNHLRHHPDCKQQVSDSSQHELKALNLHDPLQPNRNWTISPPGISSPEHPVASVLPINFKPCIDTLSINNSCSDHSNTHASFQVQKTCSAEKIFRRRFLRKNKRNEVVSSTPVKGRRTTIKDIFEGADESVNIREPAPSISSDYNKSSQTEELRNVPPMEEDIKHEFPYLANSSPNREEVEIIYHQRPFRCEVCGRSYRHAGSLINHKQTHKTGIFRCSICQKRFFNLMAMKNHNRIHYELKRHTCLDCGKAFRLRKQLETHQRIHWKKTATRKFGRRTRRGTKFRKFPQVQPKTNLAEQNNGVDEKSNISSVKIKRDPASKPYQCQECGRSYRYAGSLCNHKKSHKTGPYSCSVCQKIYSNLMAMKNHERIHYDAKRHHCPQCGKTFKWKRQLTKHKLVHGRSQSGSQPLVKLQEASVTSGHKGRTATRVGKRPKKNRRPVSNELKDSQKSIKIESVCTATACGVLLSSNGAVKSHNYSQNSVKVLDSGNVAHKSVSSKEDDERPYRCQLCDRTYRHAASLVNHKKTHEKGIFKCPLCSKQFFNALAIKNHLCTHKGKKKFSCVECGKAFRSSRELTRHRRTHMGVGPFFCPTCNVEFSSRVTLKHHQRIHKESENVPSQSSSQKETNLSKCIVPKSCKLEPTRVSLSVRKYECKQCGRSYLHASSLFNHQKTHKVGVYKCSDCFKEFSNLLAFKNHRRIHKFPCKECGKAFRIASHLAAHSKIHEQEGSLTCALCDKQFSSRSSFEHHQTMHNGPDGDFIEPQPLSNLMVKVT